VCVDPLGEDVEFTVERADDVVRLRTSELVVSLWLDPFRLDVHRSDGSAVLETADDDGHFWGYATLNDAFTLRRRCTPEDAIYGLGEKTGHQNRRGRDFTLWNIDVLDPYTTREFTAGRPESDPRSDRTSTEFDPYYVSIPFFYHQSYPTGQMSASFVDNGYRGHYDFTDPSEYRIQFDGGQYTEYVFAGPDMAAILAAYTWLTGRIAPPPLWALGYHQCRWFRYTQDDVEQVAAQHRSREIPCDGLWLDIEYMDGYRVFTWDEQAFPDVDGMLRRLDEQGFKVITIVDPGVKQEPGYWVFDQARERDVLCKTEGGDTYIGQVWPGSTAFPDFVTETARDWWGELNAAHVRSGLAGIWNDMNEPATGAIPSDRMRFDGGQHSHERYHNQYALLMAMGTTAGLLAAMPERRTFVLSRAGSAGIQRYAANWMGDNQSRWDHLWLSMPMASGLGISGQAFRRRGHWRFPRELKRGALPALDAVRRPHPVLPQPLRDRQRRPVRVDVGRRHRAVGRRRHPAALPADAVPLRDLPTCRRDWRARPASAGLRPPVRPDGARHRRRVPLRAGPARGPGVRARLHGPSGLPAHGHLVRLALRRGS